MVTTICVWIPLCHFCRYPSHFSLVWTYSKIAYSWASIIHTYKKSFLSFGLLRSVMATASSSNSENNLLSLSLSNQNRACEAYTSRTMAPVSEAATPQEPQQEQSPPAAEGPRQPDVWNKDMVETGRWGSRSRKELYIVAGVAVLMVVMTVVGVLVSTKDARSGVDKNNNGGMSKIDPVTGKRVSLYQLPKPPVPTIVDEQGEWDAVREKFSTNAILTELLTSIPATVAEIASVGATATDPYLKAAHWLTTVDTVNEREWAPIRFALASIYYVTGGDEWTNQTNWLSTANHCQWYGIACCEVMQASLLCSSKDFYNVVEIDMYNNSLTGTIPNTFGLFPDLQSLFLSENYLTGSINGDVFLGLQYFTKLYVQHNELTGTIPLNLDANGKFDTLYVQGNMMTGSFPDTYCADGNGGVATVGKMVHFGMDCDEVACSAHCCQTWENCFYNNSTKTKTARA